ncbi:PREDICTED: prothymosin alpha-like [Chrysochloris asiatica]|uniref:Prothymosin alpha n=1 Tax=Chrysochloris asiatica TaxID=185453 RepID=A0A9B0T530_CHRAS|nr:PREDICTED: prothymosin alpha-like [Chrysochloris asiatica]
MSDTAVDTSSKIITRDLKKKEVVEETENGRDAPANGNTKEENGEQKADNDVDEEKEGEEEKEEEEEGDGEEDDEDDDLDTKKQKTSEDDQTAKKGKLNFKRTP